jgi:exopolysaccharide biosynthesis predicted pyruvyltransferase EpsI
MGCAIWKKAENLLMLSFRNEIFDTFKYLNITDPIMVDWPNYKNHGDHFIALGTYLCLRDLNKTPDVGVHPSIKTPHQDILVNGGGNLGDVFISHEEYRRELCGLRNRIIVCPQSIFFEDQKELDKSAKLYERANIVVMCRDRDSFKIAKNHFKSVIETPDMALYLYPLIQEMMKAQVDTITRDSSWSDTVFNLRINNGKMKSSLSLLIYSMFQLSGQKKITTNRLHVAILAKMMGIEVETLPLKNNKIHNFFNTWSL